MLPIYYNNYASKRSFIWVQRTWLTLTHLVLQPSLGSGSQIRLFPNFSGKSKHGKVTWLLLNGAFQQTKLDLSVHSISFYCDLSIFVGYTMQLAGSRFPDQELNPSPWLWKYRALLDCHKFPHFVFFSKMCVFRWEVSTVRGVSFFYKIWSQCCKFPKPFGRQVCMIPDALGVCDFWDCL